jgi:hypothetical protein
MKAHGLNRSQYAGRTTSGELIGSFRQSMPGINDLGGFSIFPLSTLLLYVIVSLRWRYDDAIVAIPF